VARTHGDKDGREWSWIILKRDRDNFGRANRSGSTRGKAGKTREKRANERRETRNGESEIGNAATCRRVRGRAVVAGKMRHEETNGWISEDRREGGGRDARQEKIRKKETTRATKAEEWFRTGRGKEGRGGPKIWGTHAVNPRLESYPIV